MKEDNYFSKQAQEHYRQYEHYKELSEKYVRNKDIISIGAIIRDKERNEIIKVIGLSNGSNDFEAIPLNKKGTGRGYHYIVEN